MLYTKYVKWQEQKKREITVFQTDNIVDKEIIGQYRGKDSLTLDITFYSNIERDLL